MTADPTVPDYHALAAGMTPDAVARAEAAARANPEYVCGLGMAAVLRLLDEARAALDTVTAEVRTWQQDMARVADAVGAPANAYSTPQLLAHIAAHPPAAATPNGGPTDD